MPELLRLSTLSRHVVFSAVVACAAIGAARPPKEAPSLNFTCVPHARWRFSLDAAARNIAGVGRAIARRRTPLFAAGRVVPSLPRHVQLDVLPSVPAFTQSVTDALPARGPHSTRRRDSPHGARVHRRPRHGRGRLQHRQRWSSVPGRGDHLFGSIYAGFWDFGNPGTPAETRFGGINSTVTLTSGTANYAGLVRHCRRGHHP